MPVSYTVFPEKRFLLVLAQGVVSYADLRSWLDDLLLDPDWRPGFRQLIDLTRVEKLTPTPVQLRGLADRARTRQVTLGGGRIAVVAPADHVFGVVRMYQAFSQDLPRSLRVFREMEAAIQWLEAPSEVWRAQGGSGDAGKQEKGGNSKAS